MSEHTHIKPYFDESYSIEGQYSLHKLFFRYLVVYFNKSTALCVPLPQKLRKGASTEPTSDGLFQNRIISVPRTMYVSFARGIKKKAVDDVPF